MRRLELLIPAVLSLLTVACETSGPPVHVDQVVEFEGWFEVRTPRFVLRSAATRERTLALAADLEAFAGVMRAISVMRSPAPPRPVYIYLFRDERTFAHFGGSRDVRGAFLSLPRASYIVATPTTDSGRRILFHEYVHSLLAAGSELTYPPWYEEGLADFLSTVGFREHLISLGGTHPWRVPSLAAEAMALERVLAARNYADVEGEIFSFYAHSWLLTHFLYLGHFVGEPNRVSMLRAYLAMGQGSADWRESYGASFDVPLEDFEQALQAYRDRVVSRRFTPRLRLDARELDLFREVSAEDVAPAEIAFALGAIHLDWGELALREAGTAEEVSAARAMLSQAGRLFARCIEYRPDHVDAIAARARVLSGLGESDRGFALAERALELRPDRATGHRARGVLRIRHAAGLADRTEAARMRELGRTDLRRSIELDPSSIESQVFLGSSYLDSDAEDVAERHRGVEARVSRVARVRAPEHRPRAPPRPRG